MESQSSMNFSLASLEEALSLTKSPASAGSNSLRRSVTLEDVDLLPTSPLVSPQQQESPSLHKKKRSTPKRSTSMPSPSSSPAVGLRGLFLGGRQSSALKQFPSLRFSSLLSSNSTDTDDDDTSPSKQKLVEFCKGLFQNPTNPTATETTTSSSVASTEQEDISCENNKQNPYTLQDYCQYLHLDPIHKTLDLSQLYHTQNPNHMVVDLIQPLPHSHLSRQYVTLDPMTSLKGLAEDLLPVRTQILQIRPDVERGLILDALVQALTSLEGTILLRRQGGHLQAVCQASVLVDAQLTTCSINKQRHLVLRIHPLSHSTEGLQETSTTTKKSEHPQNNNSTTTSTPNSTTITPSPATLRLRQAASVLQYLEQQSQKQQKLQHRKGSSSFDSTCSPDADTASLLQQRCPNSVSTPKQASAYFQTHFVVNDNSHYPALENDSSWNLILKSQSLLERIYTSLVMHTCAYSTLQHIPLGQRSSSNNNNVQQDQWLDTHYLGQLRELSRMSMLEEVASCKAQLDQTHLLEHEQHEFVISILAPIFDLYEISMKRMRANPERDVPPSLPATTIPPGFSIVAAMAVNPLVLSMDSSMDPFQQAEQAVQLVYQAFADQDDKEQAQYLQELNRHYVKLLLNQRKLQQVWMNQQLCQTQLPQISAASKEFGQLARTATNVEGRCRKTLERRCKCPLLHMETQHGRAIVTASRLLVVRNEITSLFDLPAITISVVGNLCNVHAGGTVIYTFRPITISPMALKQFVEYLQQQQSLNQQE